MVASRIHPERIHVLAEREADSSARYVLYSIQQSQRAENNHALEYAIERANELDLPVVVLFGLDDTYPEATARNFRFMLQGISETGSNLHKRGIRFSLLHADPVTAVERLADDAAQIILDRGYLRIHREWRQKIVERTGKRVVMVESDVIVPLNTASDKDEFAARTYRPKVHRYWETFLTEVPRLRLKHTSLDLELPVSAEDWSDPDALHGKQQIDRSVSPVDSFVGGSSHARQKLRAFLSSRLDDYDSKRNDPNADHLSNLSPYLHFGQISPLEVALAVREADRPGSNAYLEELIVRRELACNFCEFNDSYDRYNGLPDWCKITLAEHQDDPRDYLYTRDQWEAAATHDPYWNACQREMVTTGKMHGYMRMYWGKKILEWSRTPEEAFDTALYLNNRYELDGIDPNGFTGVAWCFGKHDRPWVERAVYGKVRYMNANGLRRKFDADAYVRRHGNGDPDLFG